MPRPTMGTRVNLDAVALLPVFDDDEAVSAVVSDDDVDDVDVVVVDASVVVASIVSGGVIGMVSVTSYR